MSILVACTGNINRSPAVALILKQEYGIDVDQAALSSLNGKPTNRLITKKMRTLLAEDGYSHDNNRSTPFDCSKMANYNLIVVFQKSHVTSLNNIYTKHNIKKPKIINMNIKDPAFVSEQSELNTIYNQLKKASSTVAKEYNKYKLLNFIEEMKFFKSRLIMGDDEYIQYGYFTMYTAEKRKVVHAEVGIEINSTHKQLYLLTTAISRAYSDLFIEHMRQVNDVNLDDKQAVLQFFKEVPRSLNNIPFFLREGEDDKMYEILSGKSLIDLNNMPAGFGNFYKQSVIECGIAFDVKINGSQKFGYFGSTTGKALIKLGLPNNMQGLEEVKIILEEYYGESMYIANASDIICDYKRYDDIIDGSTKYRKSMLRDSKQLIKFLRRSRKQ